MLYGIGFGFNEREAPSPSRARIPPAADNPTTLAISFAISFFFLPSLLFLVLNIDLVSVHIKVIFKTINNQVYNHIVFKRPRQGWVEFELAVKGLYTRLAWVVCTIILFVLGFVLYICFLTF